MAIRFRTAAVIKTTKTFCHFSPFTKKKKSQLVCVDRESIHPQKPQNQNQTKSHPFSSSCIPFFVAFNGLLICSGNCVWWGKMCVLLFSFFLFLPSSLCLVLWICGTHLLLCFHCLVCISVDRFFYTGHLLICFTTMTS